MADSNRFLKYLLLFKIDVGFAPRLYLVCVLFNWGCGRPYRICRKEINPHFFLLAIHLVIFFLLFPGWITVAMKTKVKNALQHNTLFYFISYLILFDCGFRCLSHLLRRPRVRLYLDLSWPQLSGRENYKREKKRVLFFNCSSKELVVCSLILTIDLNHVWIALFSSCSFRTKSFVVPCHSPRREPRQIRRHLFWGYCITSLSCFDKNVHSCAMYCTRICLLLVVSVSVGH